MISRVYETRQWNAAWICAQMGAEDRVSPVFRKHFQIAGEVREARLFICGLGLFEAEINGSPADDSFLNPVNTDYTQTALYREFDIAALLVQGENTIRVELGNGFFNSDVKEWSWSTAPWRDTPRLIAELVITFVDGTVQTVSSDESWQVTLDGPVVVNEIYRGELYDARRREEDFAWTNAIPANAPQGELRRQEMPIMRKIAQFVPESITRFENGTYCITAPEMITGWMKLKIRAPKDTKIVIDYAERIGDDGRIEQILKNEDGEMIPWQRDTVICDGSEFEYEPRFTYHGFMYIQIEGYPEGLTAEDIVLYRVANDVETVSSFKCSNEMINRLHDLMKRTLLNNFQGKPTDTPVYEKNGWLGDLNVALKSILYNFDVNEFLANFTFMMADCMHDCDNITIMIPSVIWKRRNSPVWNTVFVFTIEALYDYYGNTDIVSRLYSEVRRLAQKDIEFVESRGWVWDLFELADWVAPMNDEFCAPNAGMSEGIEICGTVYIHAMLHSAARLARLMDKEEDAQEYEVAAKKIREAFNARYYRPETCEYVTEFWEEIGIRSHYRQTSNLLALAFGMAPEGEEERIFARLVESFESRDYHLDTGCVGTPLVLPVLFDYGRADIAWKVLTQTTYPSWGYWIEKGATTAWEHWEMKSRSLDHYFLGTYEEALYSHILGIRNIRDGFKKFIVAPEIGCGLEFAEGSIKTPLGTVSSAWKVCGGETNVNIAIPEGAEAVIRLPGYEKAVVGGVYCFKVAAGGTVVEQ